MKINYKTLILFFMIAAGAVLHAQFSGSFAPANWGTVAVNSNGITNSGNAPTSIYMVSGDGGSGAGTNDYTITVPQTGIITFSWNYTTVDGPSWDYPMYLLNGTPYMLTGYSTTGSSTQNGSQACISVTVGQVFGFRMYTVDNFGGPATTTFSSLYFSAGNLSITPSNPTVCPGSTLALTATGGTNYVWSGGITNGGTFTPTASTVYTVTSGVSGCTTSKTVGVVYNPLLSITGPTSNICAYSSATLTGNGGTTYTWSTGAISPSIVITPSVNGTYTVFGLSTLGCNTQGVKSITVDPGIPVVTASSSSSGSGVCPGKTLTLTGGGATTYTWTGGITNGVAFAPASSNTYIVTGGNSCGTATAAISVSIHPLPNITPVASTSSLCSGATLTLTGVGNSTAYAWSGGAIPITNGAGFSPVASVNYSVIGTSALSCTALATVSVAVVQTPSFAPTANSGIICLGQTSTLTATGATSYTWASLTSTVFTSSMAVTPTSSGISTYTVTRTNSNCLDTKTISVLTNSLPVIFAIVSPTLVCALNPATLAVGGAQSYTWTTPTFSFTGSSPVVSPPASTTYTVLGFNGSCSNTTTVFLAANPNPTITTVPGTTAICRGQPITMTASGGINYTWTASTGTFFTATITETPNIATAYNVSADNAFGCTSGAGVVVIVNNNPTITIVPSKTLVCSNGPSTLTAAGANTYTWDANANGALTTTTIVHPASLTSAPVIYTVQGTYTLTGCQSSKTVQVSVFVPTLTATGNTNTCYGGLITLNAGGGINNSYSWNTGSGPPYGFSTISTTLTASATWTLSANSLSAGVTCPSTKTIALGIYYNPTVTAVAQRTIICRNESVMLTGAGAVSYTWSNNMAGTTITVSPTGNSVSYTATGTDANGCSSTGTVLVKISGCSGINELNATNDSFIIYPNPNNGSFVIESGSEMNLSLVNELGQIIRTISMSGSTTHKVSITDIPRGVYFITGKKDGLFINQKVVVTD